MMALSCTRILLEAGKSFATENTEIHPEVGKNQCLNTGLPSSKGTPFG
jgi:hypothetical protein